MTTERTLHKVIDYLIDAAWRVNWKPDEGHSLQARYDALRSLVSVYAYATLVSLETLQRTDSGAACRVAEHLSHDDWDARSECARLWHDTLTGGPRFAQFDEELHLLAGGDDPKHLIETATKLGFELGKAEGRKQALAEIADEMGVVQDDPRIGYVTIQLDHGSYRLLQAHQTPLGGRTGDPASMEQPEDSQALSIRIPGGEG